jgi:3-methyladenine DNA glycosylase AlkD
MNERGRELDRMEELLDSLVKQRDSERASQMSAYLRNQFEFLGLPAPERKKAQKPFLTAMKGSDVDWTFVERCWQHPYRELQYVAIDYLVMMRSRLQKEELVKIADLVIRKSWWDTVDGLNKVVSGLVVDFPVLKEQMLEWSLADNFWLRRIAIDHQLLRKENTDTQLLETIILNNLGSEEFFINKAVGWSLRDYAKTNPDWVRSFLEKYQDQLATLTIREATKHLGGFTQK